jgi:hypothetical protein
MRVTLTVAAILFTYAGGAGAAADWSFDPKVIAQFETDDNNRLSHIPEQKVSVEGVAIDAQLNMRARTPRSDLTVIPRVMASFYPNEEDEERRMGAVSGDWRYVGERWNARVDGSFTVRTILGRLFGEDDDGGGLGEPEPGTGAGRSTDETEQYSTLFRPRFDFAFTERTSWLLEGRYKNVEFDDQVEDDRQNFEDVGMATGLAFQTSPTARLSVLGGVSYYSPEDGIDSKAQNLFAEWSNAMSETTRYYFRGGADRVKIDEPEADWETGFSGGAGVEWQFEVTQLFLDYNHYLDPSASGRMVNRDQLRFELLRLLSERSSLRFTARAIQDEKAIDEDDLEKREFRTGGVQYEWRFRQSMSLVGGYEYTWREYENDPADATSNRFYLGVRYQPNRGGAGMSF